MTPDQSVAQKSAAPNGSRDLISRLYREIGISAVAAALEAIARKPQKPLFAKPQGPPCGPAGRRGGMTQPAPALLGPSGFRFDGPRF